MKTTTITGLQGPLLISDKINFKTKTVTRNEEGNLIVIEGSITREDIRMTNICAATYSPKIHEERNRQ